MNRRTFLCGLTLGALVAPLAAWAQQVKKVPRIGLLQRARNENVGTFIEALRDEGYVDGRNAVIETRIYEGSLDRLRDRFTADGRCSASPRPAPWPPSRVARGTVVLGAMDDIDFLPPVKVGQMAILRARVEDVGTSSLEVGVRVFAEGAARR